MYYHQENSVKTNFELSVGIIMMIKFDENLKNNLQLNVV